MPDQTTAPSSDEQREHLVRLVNDLAATLADPTQAWDIALADFEHDLSEQEIRRPSGAHPDEYANPSISVSEAAGVTRLRVWTDVLNGESFDIVLDPGQALDLGADIVSHARYAVGHAAKALAIGDCGECRNVRLVDVERHGRPWRVNCPSCNPDGNATQAAFPAFPRVGGGSR